MDERTVSGPPGDSVGGFTKRDSCFAFLGVNLLLGYRKKLYETAENDYFVLLPFYF